MIDFNQMLENDCGLDKESLSRSKMLLEKYDFPKNFKALEEIINSEFIQGKKNVDFTKLSSNFLTSVNSKLSIIPLIDKTELESIIAKLGQSTLYKILSLHPNPNNFLEEVSKGLTDSTEINNWNKNELNAKLNIETINATTKAVSKSNIIKKPGFEVILNSSFDVCSIITDFLYNHDIIKSKKEFKKIFFPSSTPFQIKINPSKMELLMVLIKTLCENKIIKPKGTRGYFDILTYHFVNLDENPLLKNKPKYVMLQITKNLSKYNKYKAICAKLFKELKLTLN